MYIHIYKYLVCVCVCVACNYLKTRSEGRAKFGVGGADAGRTVWRITDNLEKTLLSKLEFTRETTRS